MAFAVFCLSFPAGGRAASARPAELGLGDVHTQLDALGPGKGEHISQDLQPQARTIENRASPPPETPVAPNGPAGSETVANKAQTKRGNPAAAE
ncbi:hypothetical protein [Streptomyces cinereoruber]|uniref:hypothetical protein n=1 Tax=Streptomyces cinereoruber TaxID=67260 RepID=UPI00363F9474